MRGISLCSILILFVCIVVRCVELSPYLAIILYVTLHIPFSPPSPSPYLNSLYADSPDQCIDQCILLLNDPHIDAALRTGDVYAMIITHYSYHGDHQQV